MLGNNMGMDYQCNQRVHSQQQQQQHSSIESILKVEDSKSFFLLCLYLNRRICLRWLHRSLSTKPLPFGLKLRRSRYTVMSRGCSTRTVCHYHWAISSKAVNVHLKPTAKWQFVFRPRHWGLFGGRGIYPRLFKGKCLKSGLALMYHISATHTHLPLSHIWQESLRSDVTHQLWQSEATFFAHSLPVTT